MKYFALQCKRIWKLLPFVLLIAVLLIASMTVLLVKWTSMDNAEKTTKLKIGIVGGFDNSIYQWGFAALQTIDSSRYTLSIEQVTEPEAKKKLLQGKLNAYVVIPEDFIQLAMKGKIQTIPYYTTVGSKGITALLKDEFTGVISRMLEESQKGVYGLYDALYDYEDRSLAESESDALSFAYADFILNRSFMYQTKSIGVYDGLSFFEYLLSGFAVLLFCILLLPFASFYIKRDLSIYKILASNGKKPPVQIFSEYGALLLSMLSVYLILLLIIKVAYDAFGSTIGIAINFEPVLFALSLFPVLALLTAFAFMIYEFSDNLISGVVIYFFSFLFLSYISGCAYPIYMLPDILQKTARFLPMGAARNFIASGMTGKIDYGALLTVIGLTILFLAISVMTRYRKLNGRGN